MSGLRFQGGDFLVTVRISRAEGAPRERRQRPRRTGGRAKGYRRKQAVVSETKVQEKSKRLLIGEQERQPQVCPVGKGKVRHRGDEGIISASQLEVNTSLGGIP